MFRSNQHKFYRSLEEDSLITSECPPLEEIVKFWDGLWGSPGHYNEDASWLQIVKGKIQCCEMNEVSITSELFRAVIKKHQIGRHLVLMGSMVTGSNTYLQYIRDC